MTSRLDAYAAALDRASARARAWLASMPDHAVPPRLTADELRTRMSRALPEGPNDAADVVDELAELVEPGLMAMSSGRFFGWVIGGSSPRAI